jgi:serine phosphatase RsbU (regulator of sigma subunit)
MEVPPVVDVQRLLNAVEDVPPVGALEVMAHELASALDATAVSFLAVDLGGRQLARLVHVSGRNRAPAAADDRSRRSGQDRADVVLLPLGGEYEGVLRSQQILSVPADGRWRVVVPVSERGEVVGLLEMLLPAEPNKDVSAYLRSVGHLLAFVVVANRRHTDLFEWGQRSAPLTLSAEIQRRLLPDSFTLEAGPLTLAGWLEPAVSVAGDTFDYSLDREVLHLSITDAMGHGVSSALLATLLVGSLRNSRRRGLPLNDTAAEANVAVVENAPGGDGFVTGLLIQVDLASGSALVVNAGHTPPYLLRGEAMYPIELPADLPFGMFPDQHYRLSTLSLDPDDRLVMVTDGMLDRNAATLDLPDAINRARGLHPREAVRNLADNVLSSAGGPLQDDATVLILDWHGPNLARDSDAGTSLDRQSPPHRDASAC